MSYSNRKGFTLIELVVVMVVIAILAVVAMPRFINLSTQSYQAQIEGISAQFSSAVSFSQKRWITNGATPESQLDLDGYGGGQLDVNDLGFPIGIDKGNSSGIMTNPYQIGKGEEGCVSIWESIVEGDSSVASIDAATPTDFNYISQRVNLTFTPGNSTTPITQGAVCAYALTAQGFNSTEPMNSEFVIWYNSRTGSVSPNRPNGI